MILRHRRRRSVIRAPSGPAYPVELGGGWWELSDGGKVQGRQAAAAAQDALDGQGGGHG